ncbi:dehydrogenase [Saccharomonospora sp. CUA-673]|uniref:Gfo/Idh/MocA family protein n=1 Tax=Saccharomonospora sp. CUA-673 TaxID=1904969 RepID=UPI00096A037D|nr:Gfo/Idh/MocA family oxidoreductase [Saccharomonospora sp. CUA-673]OLT38647.1 dehydrogenase [Saccharomonospora sp. CUA-673]
MNDTQLRVGLVGGGPWARTVHAPGLSDHPATKLEAVWTRRPDMAAEVADEHDAVAVGSFDELLDAVDTVAFAVPPSVQGELAVRAAEAGKHLILEKPLAGDVATAERLAAAVDAAGVASLLMLTMRYGQQTRDWITGIRDAGGWSGGAARWLSGAMLGDKYGGSTWRLADGVLVDVGPHVIDLLDAALGPVTGVLSAHRTDADLWHLVLEHDRGPAAPSATSTVSMSTRVPVRPTVAEFTVYGEHGMRTMARGGSASESYTALLDDFAALCATGLREHECDVRRGLHLQRVLAACVEAAG